VAPKSWLYAVKKTRHACSIWELNPDLVHPLTKLLYRLGYTHFFTVVMQIVCQFVG